MKEKQYTKYTVDFRNVTHFLEMHAILAESLEFPDYYGYSWDAFWDFLNEPFCESIYIEILGIDVIERLFDDDAKMLLSTLKEWKHFGTDHDEDIRIEIVRGDERIEIDDYPIAE